MHLSRSLLLAAAALTSVTLDAAIFDFTFSSDPAISQQTMTGTLDISTVPTKEFANKNGNDFVVNSLSVTFTGSPIDGTYLISSMPSGNWNVFLSVPADLDLTQNLVGQYSATAKKTFGGPGWNLKAMFVIITNSSTLFPGKDIDWDYTTPLQLTSSRLAVGGVTFGPVMTLTSSFVSGGPSNVTGTIGANDSAVTSGNPLQLEGGKFAPTGTGVFNLTNDINVVAGSSAILDATGQNINSTGAVAIAGTSLNLAGSATSGITLSGAITGAGSVINNSGNNVISGANTSGGTQVTGGSLRLASGASLAPSNDSVSSGGTMILPTNVGFHGAVTIAGAGAAGQSGALVFDGAGLSTPGNSGILVTLSADARVALTDNTAYTLAGAIDATSAGKTLTLDTGSATLQVAGGIKSNVAQVVKTGSGILSVSSNISGAINVQSGELLAGVVGALGSGVTVQSGASVRLQSLNGTPLTYTAPITISGNGGQYDAGALNLVDPQSITYAGQVTLAASATVQSSGANHSLNGSVIAATPGQSLNLLVSDNSLAITGVVAASVSNLTKSGSGTLGIASGASVNSANVLVSGGRLINQGTVTGAVNVSSGATLGGTGTIAGTVTLAGTGAAGQSGALIWEASAVTAAGSGYAVTLSGDAKISVSGTGSYAYAGTLGATSAGRALTIDTGAALLQSTGGVTSDISQFTKAGSGTLGIAAGATINSANVLVSDGRLTNDGTVTGNVNVSSGATLGGTGAIAGAVTLAGAGATGQSGALVWEASVGSGAGSSYAVTLAADSKISVNGTGSYTYAGALDASSPSRSLTIDTGTALLQSTGGITANISQVTKLGSGTLTVASGSNVGSSNVAVTDGRLVNNGTVAGTVNVSSGATLGGTGAIAGAVTLAGAGATGQSGALVWEASVGSGAGSAYAVTLAADSKISVNGTGNYTYAGALGATSAGRALTIDTGTAVLNSTGGVTANISQVTKLGSGTLTIAAGSNIGSSNVAVTAGRLVNEGTFAGAVNVSSGATLGGTGTIAGTVTLAGAGATGQSGALVWEASAGSGAGSAYAVTLAADSKISVSGTGNYTYAGTLGASSAGRALTIDTGTALLQSTGGVTSNISQLTKVGSGTLTIAAGSNIGSSNVAVTDGRLINNGTVTGTVNVAAGATLSGTGTIAGKVTMAGSGSSGQAGALVWEASGVTPVGSNYAVTLAGDAKIIVNGTGSYAYAGTLDASSAGRALTIDTGTAVLNSTGGVTANISQVTKLGSGTLTIAAGSNIGSSNVAVTAGRLVNEGTFAGAVNVSSGATLGGTGTIAGTVTLAGAGATGQSGALVWEASAGSGAGSAYAVTLAADSKISVSGTGNYTYAGTLGASSAGRALTIDTGTALLQSTGGVTSNILQVTKVGTGTLKFAAGARVEAADVLVEAGLLTNNGDIRSKVVVLAAATLGGSGMIAGSVTVAGTLAPGNSPGLQIQTSGNTTLTSGAHFQAQLGGITPGNGNGHYDQYNVLNGSFNIQPGVTLDIRKWTDVNGNDFIPARRDTFTFITASDGITGGFADVTNTDYSQFILLDNNQGAHANGNLYGTGLSGNQTFATYGKTSARATVGASLWAAAISLSSSSTPDHPVGIFNSNTGAGQAVIDLLNAPDVDVVLDALSPEAYLSVGDYALTVSRSLTEAAFGQTSLLKTGAWTLGAGFNRAQHGYRGASSVINYDLSADTPMMTVTYDCGQNSTIGFFYGMNTGKALAGASRLDFRGSFFGLTSTCQINAAHPIALKAAVVASDLSFDATRSGSITQDASLRSLGGQLTAAVQLYKQGRLTFSPTLGYVVGRSTAAAFTESGSNANLAIDALEQGSSRVVAGFAANYLLSNTLTLEFTAAYEHEFAADAGSVSATFAGATSPVSMVIDRSVGDRSTTSASLGANWQLENSITLRLSAEARGNRELHKDYRYNVGLNFRF